jgi:aspartate dehydrogenase
MRRIGLLGVGAIGMAVVRAIEAGQAPGHRLAAILARPRQLDALHTRFDGQTLVTADAKAFVASDMDLVVEAVGHEATLALGPPILERGRDLYLMSVGVLADAAARAGLEDAARRGSAQIVIPSGALAGFDGLRALAQLEGCEVTYTSTKPPSAWGGTPGEAAIRARPPHETVVIFDGAAGEAALKFPKNANLAAAVALAGVGFEKTRVRLVSDPHRTENLGTVEARTPSTVMQLSLSGSAFRDNPKSSQITAASIVAALAADGAVLAWG